MGELLLMKIKFFFFVLLGIVTTANADRYDDFANHATQNPNNLYIASLFVGNGECHIVRQGSISILIEAGMSDDGSFRDYDETHSGDNAVSNIEKMLAGSKLHGIFTTNNYYDRINLIRKIMLSNVEKHSNIFLAIGGTLSDYKKLFDNTKFLKNINVLDLAKDKTENHIFKIGRAHV